MEAAGYPLRRCGAHWELCWARLLLAARNAPSISPGGQGGVHMLQNRTQATRPTASPTILLIDSHPLTRKHIAGLIRARYRAARVLTAGCLDEAEAWAADLVVINVNVASPDHPAVPPLLEGIGRRFPEVPLTIICGSSAYKATPRGVRGILPLSLPADVLVAALRLVMAGGVYLHADAPQADADIPAATLADGADDPQAGSVAHAAAYGLTVREHQVLELLRQGRANKLIAHELHISEHTVKVYVRRIMRKLNVANRTQAAFVEVDILRPTEGPGWDVFGGLGA